MESMRTHVVVAAWLHLVAALFVIGCVSTIWVAAAMLAPYFAGSFVPDLIAAVGRPVAIFLLLVAGIDGIAATVLLTAPAPWARRTTMTVSLLLVPVFPIGTALAVYTFWALWRRVDEPPGRAVVLSSGPRR